MQQGAFVEAVIPLERLKEMRPDDVSARATLIEADLRADSRARVKMRLMSS